MKAHHSGTQLTIKAHQLIWVRIADYREACAFSAGLGNPHYARTDHQSPPGLTIKAHQRPHLAFYVR
jgi:hypothetical protein